MRLTARCRGFSDEQTLQIRSGIAPFAAKLDVLAHLARSLTVQRGHIDPERVDVFLAAGWTKADLIDTNIAVGNKTVSNYLYSATQIPIDFPAAPELPARSPTRSTG